MKISSSSASRLPEMQRTNNTYLYLFPERIRRFVDDLRNICLPFAFINNNTLFIFSYEMKSLQRVFIFNQTMSVEIKTITTHVACYAGVCTDDIYCYCPLTFLSVHENEERVACLHVTARELEPCISGRC